jgi:hypothetical protein
MEAIRELKRQLVIAGRQVQNRFGISFAEVPVRIVRRNHLAGRKKFFVDQDMVMSGAFNNLARRLDFHSLHLHDYLYGPFDFRTVLWFCKGHFAFGCLFLSTSSDG